MVYHPTASLQCIDLSSPDINQSVATIKEACMDSGMFYVINHGISKELTHELFAQSKKFFELPMSEKMKLRRNDGLRGYNQPSKSYAETFAIGASVTEDDPQNIWPPADIFPRWKETVQRYCQEATDVGRAVARIIALALDINVDFFDQQKMFGDATQFNMLHYGDGETDLSGEQKGTLDHCDTNLLTLVTTSDVWGLQICKDKYANPQLWEYVPPLEGAIIVNAGDMLEMISNGIFRATLHRAVYREERYSFALFIMPCLDAVIECLPSCISEENPPKYLPNKCAEILGLQVKKNRVLLENKSEV